MYPSARRDDAVTREEERNWIARHHLSDGARRQRMADLAGDPAVGTHLARRNFGGLGQRGALDVGQLRNIDGAQIGPPGFEPLFYSLEYPSGRLGELHAPP